MASWTATALRAVGLVAVLIFAAALSLHVGGLAEQARTVAAIGVLAVIATPPIALLATIAESFRTDRATAWLALAVLAVLGVATAISLVLR